MNAIEVRNLTKSYDGINKALDNINFIVPEGSIVGFLGPNGSGKTTTVRILNGILAPSEGEVKIFERDVTKDQIKIHSLSGVMTETACSYENLSGEENLIFFGKMHGLNNNEIKKRSNELLNRLELEGVRHRKVKAYSTGMKKRISLAIALIHNPKILFLDEPTSGLDPESAENVTKLIKNMTFENKSTVFMCTHQLKYAQDICSLYALINKGTLLGFGSFEELCNDKNFNDSIIIRGENIPNNVGLNKIDINIYRKHISNDEEVAKLLHNIFASNGKIYEVRREKPSLEDLYFSYVRGDKFE
ncbi:ABC transporter family protein [Clostridium argentinense CDC 2741]|uniref:ABC transporter family protein n=1 Tax=Clostridium argentinense CDC 2741 TaxID=1418104 RepID=A0A0C1U5T6_9CLOT|nr:ABC transporter ATP-binding protein [Clostridium argentinense]ARC85407.1 multidrug ABC transporter ATP-binding protein [Clostridium argentinense]KIE47118.1 ABC transporter family protein [Clostridium argentinense CDC 2741]NFF41298.1 ABC transporter ATP-binding protein [Clostridium argentinense]NFP52225.1 ABC transporter ATP-binding protein [Clostridium argentinense]NFP72025.1 ABC transporter ATP-binding protein [Clostridium argentinense]